MVRVRDENETGSDLPDDPGTPLGERAPSTDAEREQQSTEGLARTLAEAEAQAKLNLDGWQRERASFANYRRRVEQERAALSQEGCAEAVCRLLPILDDLELACRNVPPELINHPWADGVCMIPRKFGQVIEQLGVQVIEAEGRHFDPTLHEAITHEDTGQHAEGKIIGEVARGFRLGDRVLRCSKVRVAKGTAR